MSNGIQLVSCSNRISDLRELRNAFYTEGKLCSPNKHVNDRHSKTVSRRIKSFI